jgi:hypothetical protein
MARRSNEELRKLAEKRQRHRGKVPDEWLDFPLTRTEAKKASIKYYFTGDPCQMGHIALRWSGNGGCLECGSYKNIPKGIKSYTAEEDEYIRQNYQKQTRQQMADALGRTRKSVEKRMLSVLNIRIDVKTRDAIRKQNTISRNTQGREKHRGNVPDEWFELPPTQEEAQRLGVDYFFTGLTCERGHIDIRGANHRTCLECLREKSKRDSKTDKRKEWKRTYRRQEHVREKENEYRKQVLQNDPVFKLRLNVSVRITNFFAGRKSAGKLEKAEELLGSSYENFHQWISNQLTDGMTMENYGLKGWHLDHVRPVMSFRDKQIDKELEVQKVAFNWRNYQPLWGADNQSKNDDWTPQMEKAWIERMRSLGWEGRLFPIFDEEIE